MVRMGAEAKMADHDSSFGREVGLIEQAPVDDGPLD
jgi:hypothetical protein